MATRKGETMALIVDSGECRHCGEAITQRVYAAPYSPDPDARRHGVRKWVTGAGQYPGDQGVCESHDIGDDIGSYGAHEPVTLDAAVSAGPWASDLVRP